MPHKGPGGAGPATSTNFGASVDDVAIDPHDIRVAPRWFIPFSLVVFSVLVGVLWAYLTSAMESDPRQWRRDGSGTLLDSADLPKHDRPSITIAPRQNGSSLSPRSNRRSRGLAASDISERVDDVAAQLCGDLSDTTAVELLGARSDLAAGRIDAAVRGFDRVLEKSPRNAFALAGKAAAFVSGQRMEEAAVAYQALLRSAPRDTAGRYNYGVLLVRLSKFSDAAEQFRELVAIDARHARGQYNLASLAQRAGRLTEARDAWQAYTAIEPVTPSAWFSFGIVWLDLEEPLWAARCFAITVALRPDDPDGHLNLATALAGISDDASAAAELLQAERLSPCDPEVITRLAEAPSSNTLP